MNFKELLGKTKTALAEMGEKIAEVATNVKDNVTEVGGKVAGTVKDVAGKVAEKAVDVADDLKGSVLDFTNLRTVRERLIDAMLKATKDGEISAEEIAEFNSLQKQLQISDEEMKEIKISVLKEVINRATADGKVSPTEMKVIEELQQDLEIPTDTLKDSLEKVKKMFGE